MFAVIFEVQPKPDRWQHYLDLAKLLRPELEQIDGFVDNERFASQRTSGRLLSLSTWRDEKALVRWRTLAVHHEAQRQGRCEIFADYHLRVGEITADTHLPPGHDLRPTRFDVTEVGQARVVAIAELAAPDPSGRAAFIPPSIGQSDGLVDVECFESITTPGKLLWLAAWRDETALAAWRSRRQPPTAAGAVRQRAVRIIRDYGLADRREAPQYYPPV